MTELLPHLPEEIVSELSALGILYDLAKVVHVQLIPHQWRCEIPPAIDSSSIQRVTLVKAGVRSRHYFTRHGKQLEAADVTWQAQSMITFLQRT